MLSKDEFLRLMQERYTSQCELAPTLVIEVEDMNEAVKQRIIQFYRSRGVSRDDFAIIDNQFCVFQPHHYHKLKEVLPLTHTVILKADFPNNEEFPFKRLTTVHSRPLGCGLDYHAFLHECDLFRARYTPDKTIVILDFEAFSTDNPISLSEAGICRLQNGETSCFHSFIQFESGYNPEHAAIANIPTERMEGHPYCTLADLKEQIGSNAVICSKGTQLERAVLRRYLHIKQEVFEIQCVAALWGCLESVSGSGERCEYHSAAAGHCALEDAVSWGRRLAKLVF